jgi:hypothetical protein
VERRNPENVDAPPLKEPLLEDALHVTPAAQHRQDAERLHGRLIRYQEGKEEDRAMREFFAH